MSKSKKAAAASLRLDPNALAAALSKQTDFVIGDLQDILNDDKIEDDEKIRLVADALGLLPLLPLAKRRPIFRRNRDAPRVSQRWKTVELIRNKLGLEESKRQQREPAMAAFAVVHPSLPAEPDILPEIEGDRSEAKEKSFPNANKINKTRRRRRPRDPKLRKGEQFFPKLFPPKGNS